MLRAGITSYGISIPRRRMRVDEIIELWMNSPLEMIQDTLGVKERGVLGLDEDGNTFSVAAVKEALARTGNREDIDALYYGTCTNPYDSRPSSTILLEALDLPYSAKCADLQFATKSGTCALIHAIAMVESGMAKKAVAVGADTMNRHTSPGDLTEPYASSGAGALLVGTDNVVLQIEGVESYSSDLSDGFRVEGERYIRSGMLPGSAKNEVGVYAHTTAAGQKLLHRLNKKPEDYTYAVFQQGTPSVSYGIATGFLNRSSGASNLCRCTWRYRIGFRHYRPGQGSGARCPREYNLPRFLWLWCGSGRILVPSNRSNPATEEGQDGAAALGQQTNGRLQDGDET